MFPAVATILSAPPKAQMTSARPPFSTAIRSTGRDTLTDLPYQSCTITLVGCGVGVGVGAGVAVDVGVDVGWADGSLVGSVVGELEGEGPVEVGSGVGVDDAEGVGEGLDS